MIIHNRETLLNKFEAIHEEIENRVHALKNGGMNSREYIETARYPIEIQNELTAIRMDIERQYRRLLSILGSS